MNIMKKKLTPTEVKDLAKLEHNKVLARQLTQAQNERDIRKLKQLLSTNFKSHISDVPFALNRDQYIQGIKMSHKAFSSLIFTIEDLIAEGDKVVIRITARGKHTGNYQGFIPSQEKIKFAGIAIRRISKGKIVEEWQTNDQLSLLQQMGLSVNHII
jgi:predicted ester cyclase